MENIANISSDWLKIFSILNGCCRKIKQQKLKKAVFLFFSWPNATVICFIFVILGNIRNPRTVSKKFSKNSAKRQLESSTFYRYTKIPLILTVPGASTDGSHQVRSDLSVNIRIDQKTFSIYLQQAKPSLLLIAVL